MEQSEKPVLPAEGGETEQEAFEKKVGYALDALRQGLPLTRRDWTEEVALEASRRFEEEKKSAGG